MKRAEYCGMAVYEMLLHDYPNFEQLLTPDEQSNPNSISVEKKKELCLRYLRDKDYIPEDFDPILFQPRESFSLNVEGEKMDAFYEKIVAALNLNKPRYDAEMAKHKQGVSCPGCI